MSVRKEVQSNQSDNVEIMELSQLERKVVQLFKRLDQQQQKDILRFIDVLLKE
ncbi:hypothetical protein ATI14_6202 [Pseudomonas tolaasii NCPPB 2192]|uniref:Transcriptional regulator n=1 Tax=Pseudomonas tolaasii NCPPB 2192 TaxID=564423 RepID=A0ABX4QQB4_PSETO|nr:hypothetical protein [Pseudomonas tolaasii]NWC43436.1 hypothetical protein [Pseudomonas tolaasii]PKA79035.1 hypothetical protein ATI14_6202 [Pseudomonas tolaasii NCPPB 2192]